MTAILGISAFYHDSAAALVVDGEVVAASQEERFSRTKHDHGFPVAAVRHCLAEAGLRVQDLDHVAFYDKPLLKLDRLLETYLAHAPAGFLSFARAMPLWLRQKLHVPREIRTALGDDSRCRPIFARHHESHAASAFFPSPFEEAAILTLDGVGEWSTASLGVGEGHRIRLTHELRFPHSIGLLYSAFTYFCGFKVNSGEYKLMGLAPYGRPTYRELILEKLVDVREDGSIWMDMDYFRYAQGLTMTNERFDRLFGGPPRRAEGPITQREMDVAASVQAVTEEAMLRCARHAARTTGKRDLCLAGGVALNCVGNGRILREGPFDRIWIQPAAGDAGGALGVALFAWHQLLDQPRQPRQPDAQRGSLLGPRYDDAEIAATLAEVGARFERIEDEDELCRATAREIADGRVVGWFQGRMEFGPRALGSRSILGDPRRRDMQRVMNLKIKFRESFRPFAPSVLADRAADWFELEPGVESPYMLIVAPVRSDRMRSEPGDAELVGFEKLSAVRSDIPAVTHVDGSARVQTVDPVRHGRYHRLLRHFDELTGCPVLINTSFNVRGEPIVCTPRDAWRCFMATEMDVLVLGSFVLRKTAQEGVAGAEREAYLARFALD